MLYRVKRRNYFPHCQSVCECTNAKFISGPRYCICNDENGCRCGPNNIHFIISLIPDTNDEKPKLQQYVKNVLTKHGLWEHSNAYFQSHIDYERCSGRATKRSMPNRISEWDLWCFENSPMHKKHGYDMIDFIADDVCALVDTVPDAVFDTMIINIDIRLSGSFKIRNYKMEEIIDWHKFAEIFFSWNCLFVFFK